MKHRFPWLAIPLFLLVAVSSATAADFGWIQGFNLQAEAEPQDFRSRLRDRFNLGDMMLDAVLGEVEWPADAYMLLRLAEMAGLPVERVVKEHKAAKGKGWGALARSLGIKPGSEEFHALKQSQDLYGQARNGKGKGKGKSKGKGKGKGKKK